MTIYKYREISLTGRKALPCPKCGTRVKRQKKIWQTVNPWNRNPDGTPKTPAEVDAAVQAELAWWESTPELCTPCRVGDTEVSA